MGELTMPCYRKNPPLSNLVEGEFLENRENLPPHPLTMQEIFKFTIELIFQRLLVICQFYIIGTIYVILVEMWTSSLKYI